MRRAIAGLGLFAFVLLLPVGFLLTVGGPYVPGFSFEATPETLRGTFLPVDAVVRAIALLCWALWTYLVLIVVVRVVLLVLLRRNWPAAGVLLGMSETVTPRGVRRLVDLALGMSILISTVGAAHAAPETSHSYAHVVPRIAPSHQAEPVHLEVCRKTYVVGTGDSLWDIAEDELGSGYRWREIWNLNRGRSFPDGRELHNPRLIRPGWVLELPADEIQVRAPEPSTPASVPTPPPPQTPSAGPPPQRTTREVEHSRAPVADQAPVIELPSGAVVAASFASGILAAQALSVVRRRRFRKALAEPEEAVESTIASDLRRRVHSPTAGHLEAAAVEIGGLWQRVHTSLPRFLAALEEPDRAMFLVDASGADGSSTLPPSSARMSFRHEGGTVRVEARRPFPPKLVRAETPLETGLLVPLGAVGRKAAVHLSLLGVGGISVQGSQAPDLVAQTLVASAADTSSDDLEIYLLGELDELGASRYLNHVRGAAGWNDAAELINRIQAELLARARAFMKEGVEDFWSYLAIRVDERMPAVAVVASKPPGPLTGVVEAVASQMSSLGGSFISIGWTPIGKTFVVRAESKMEIETPLEGIPNTLRPFHLTAADVAEAVEVINSARPPSWDSANDRDREAESSLPEVDAAKETKTAERPAAPVKKKAPQPTQIIVEEEHSPLSLELDDSPKGSQIEVRTFGNFTVTKDGRVIEKSFRAPSRELLAYLVANPEGVVKDRLIEAIWPNLDNDSASTEVDRAIYYLRQRTGSGRSDHVEHFRDLYRLNFQYWWADSIAFQSLLDRAGTLAAEEAIRVTTSALDLYRGPFCDDCYYLWLEPERERYRAMFVKASARLSNLMMEYGQSADAITVLDRAIEVEPINEDLYRRAMAIEGRIGRRKAVVKRFNKLEAILQDELDVDPDEETTALFRQIMREIEGSRKALQS